MNKQMTDPGGWCKCGGKGFWMEQIDGVKMRKVICPWRHDLERDSRPKGERKGANERS